jgi:hypothetical protein
MPPQPPSSLRKPDKSVNHSRADLVSARWSIALQQLLTSTPPCIPNYNLPYLNSFDDAATQMRWFCVIATHESFCDAASSSSFGDYDRDGDLHDGMHRI